VITPRRLKQLYEQGQNISACLREELGLQQNTREIIELSYDLQAGSYVAAMHDAEQARLKQDYTQKIAATIARLCTPASVLEAGIGEGTTLSGVLAHLPGGIRSYGFDLSWSRVAYARRWLRSRQIRACTLCSGDLANIPFLENSTDVVFTSHAIEPNGGNELAIVRELYRVARRYVVLLEPAYEFASAEVRQRMDAHGYCRNLKGAAESCGYDVVEHGLFPYTGNPLNPTALTIIRKEQRGPAPDDVFACPRFKTPLQEVAGMLFSPEALVVYPILDGIPCLRIENGIVASKFPEIVAQR
jgi:ubiquinone/menaquinone biosynthesis C-methylase UbiE